MPRVKQVQVIHQLIFAHTKRRLMPVLCGCRKQELEADRVGMDLAARACFDPAAGKHVGC